MQQNCESINWPPEFSDLKRLDVILKCGICYDFMNNCMITSCSHTYCSLCIRKFMQYKNQCPTCYEETYEINLRNNRLLDEVILIYTKIRDKLLRASRLASVNVPTKFEPKENKIEIKETSPDSRPVNSIVENDKNEKPSVVKTIDLEENKNLKIVTTEDDSVVVNGVKIPGIFTSPKISCIRTRKPEELTDCPVCQVKVPARNINIHLDSCLAFDPGVRPKPKPRKRSPLPKRVYTMMPEKSIRKFLKDYGLSSAGDRKAMIARLQRYTVIYNAENDAVNPRPVSELIKQLEREEREEKKPNTIMKNIQNSAARVTISKNNIEAVEKANKIYCEENKASFKKLIEEMRARDGRNIKPLKPINRIYSDDEDDPNKVIDLVNTDLPTTSGLNSAKNTSEKNYSNQNSTNTNSDSDDDIFLNSDTEEKNVNGKIDWNKTVVTINEETPESVYVRLTYNPSNVDVDIISIDKNDNMELKEENEVTDDFINSVTTESVSTEHSDSDNSIFDIANMKKCTNKSKEIIQNTPNIKKNKSTRRRLSLSCKKKVKRKRGDLIDETATDEDSIILEHDDIEDKTFACNGNVQQDDLEEEQIKNDNDYEKNTNDASESNEIIHEVSKETLINDESDNQENSETHKSSEVTPLKRLTRSAKRKSISNLYNKSEVNTTPVTTRKKSKRDLSPAFD